jgi:sec-independent protein translocase protein TatB
MFDIGIGEIVVLAIVGLLVFGPDRLPRAAADAGRWIRTIREMAAGARKDLADSAGIDLTGTIDSVKELRDLHPRRLAAEFLSDDAPAAKPAAKPASTSDGSARPTFDPDAV